MFEFIGYFLILEVGFIFYLLNEIKQNRSYLYLCLNLMLSLLKQYLYG
jgi:hypothetical protein